MVSNTIEDGLEWYPEDFTFEIDNIPSENRV